MKITKQQRKQITQIFKEVYATQPAYNDYDIYLLPKFNENEEITQLTIEKIYGRMQHTVEEIKYSRTYQITPPLPVEETDIIQFSILDKEGNRYRFSSHLSYVARRKMFTINVRKISGSPKNVDVIPDVIEMSLSILAEGGLTLIGGRYGHGKTTFAYFLLRKWIERYPNRSFIITMEDPIEGTLPAPAKQMEMPAEYWVGNLKAVMREKPDIVFIGEILTPQMAEVLMQYASTGMSVVATIHASSTGHIFSRLKSLLQAEGNINPSRTIASAITGTIYVEFPPLYTETAKQLYEVVNWRKIYSPSVLERQIEENIIENIYSEMNTLKQQYFYPLWHSARVRGYKELSQEIEKTLIESSRNRRR